MTLAEIRAKYGISGGKYEPKADCKFCGGTGERPVKHSRGKNICICLFVQHDLSDFAGDALAETITKLKGE